MTDLPRLDGLVPDALAPATFRVFLDRYDVAVDIGFHDFEIGTPQRVLISVEVWIDGAAFAASDEAAAAWNYDFLRQEIGRLASGRRYNLQETFVREIYERVASRHGVRRLKVTACKPDVYPDCAGVGVEMASF